MKVVSGVVAQSGEQPKEKKMREMKQNEVCVIVSDDGNNGHVVKRINCNDFVVDDLTDGEPYTSMVDANFYSVIPYEGETLTLKLKEV